MIGNTLGHYRVIEKIGAGGMGRTTFVNLEEHPSLAVACRATLEGGVDGKACRNPADILMEEACMACLQLRNNLMHFLFKFLRAFDRQNPVSPGFDYRVPVHTIKFRVEVFGLDKAAHLLEKGFPVAEAETRSRQ